MGLGAHAMTEGPFSQSRLRDASDDAPHQITTHLMRRRLLARGTLCRQSAEGDQERETDCSASDDGNEGIEHWMNPLLLKSSADAGGRQGPMPVACVTCE